MSLVNKTNRSLTYGQAIFEGTYQEMERDENVIVLGLGADDSKGLFGSTKDLHKFFGLHRSFDTPLSEDGMTGVAIGAALAGLRPIHVHQRMDFILLCMNQLINLAAKTSYMFEGRAKVPLVIRNVVGRSWGQGAQHSQALHSFFMHVPGLKVVAPTTPYDAKGTLIASIRDNNPVIFMEHRMLYNFEGLVPEEPYEVPLGKGRILVEGNDITIVAISHMIAESLRAAQHLKEVGISAEVIDPITLYPMDIDLIEKSVLKTGNLLVVDCGWLNCGASAEIITQIFERLQDKKRFKAARMGFCESPCPTTRNLEMLFYPNPSTIASRANTLLGGSSSWVPTTQEAKEITAFRGPF